MFKSAPENAADIETISNLLSSMSYGATLSYGEITRSIGRNIQNHYYLLQAAQKRVEKETGALFSTVRSVGIKRLSSEDIPSVGIAAIRKVRHTARRGYKRLDGIRVNDLSAEDANKVIAHKSQLGALALVADGRKSQILSTEVEKTGNGIPAGRVLEMFKA